MIRKCTLADKLGAINEHWSPRVIGQVNDCEVKLAKLEGEFIWHHHEKEDELFLVIQGTLTMQFRDAEVDLEPGELLIVPRGVEHRPVVKRGEVHVLLFEPAHTLNTGNVVNERTVHDPERI